MGNIRRTHEQDALTDSAWQVALALDSALDHLTTPGPSSPEHQGSLVGSTNGHSPADKARLLVEAARHLSALNTAQPDTAFAMSLRQTLVKPATASPPPASSAPVSASLGIHPALPPIHRSQHRPTLRYAAMLVAALLLLGTLVGSDTIVHRLADLTNRQPEPTRSDDIPIFRNDPAGAAAHPGPGPTGPASIAWQFRAGASLTGNPVIANGVIYTGAENQRLYAIDATTGTEIWSLDTGGAVRGPAIANGIVYVVTGANDLIAVDARSGVEHWRVDLKASNVRPPTVVDGTVYVTAGEHATNNPAVADGTIYAGGGPSDSPGSPGSTLFAFDAASGLERWRHPTGDEFALYAVDIATGQLRWRFAVDAPAWGGIAVAGDTVFTGTGYGGPLLAIDTSTGQEIWRYHASVGYGPVVTGGVLYGADFALDPKTGRQIWHFDTGEPMSTAPAIVGDTAYLLTEWGTLYAIDTQSGAERWHTVIGLHIVYTLSPIVTGGKVYVAASDGALYALGDQSSDSHVAALPRDVPNPDECAVAPVDPATVAAVHPTEPQPFVWPLGSPADAATVAGVSTAYRGLVACLNAGDPRRIYPLYTSRYWQMSTSRGGTPPDVLLAGEATPLGVDEQIAIRSISDAEILPDGRVGIRTITDSRGDLPPRAVTSYLIFTQVDGRWLVDEAIPISQSTEIPPVSMPALDPASTSAALDSLSPSAPQPVPSCTVEATDPAALAATANASQPTAGPTSTPIPADVGTLPDPETSFAVRATMDEYIACLNTGERARALALVSPDFVSRVLEGRFEWSPEIGPETVTPVPELEQVVVRSYDSVRLLPDGRVVWDLALSAKGAPGARPLPVQYVFVNQDGRWLIDDIIVAAPAPDATPSTSIAAPTNVNLRSSATFSAIVFEVAVAGSPLYPAGSAQFIDGILWLPVEGYDDEHPFFVPAAYLMATGARIPGIPVPSTEETGTPHPSECTVEPIPLADVAAYMGPASSNGPRSAMAHLATVGSDTDLIVRTRVVDTLRAVYACHNAGSYTQSVALNTPAFYQQAGANAYRPNGTETDLATARPLAEENRSELLAIGTVHHLDDGRVGVVVIGVSHDDPIQVGSTFFILARPGDRWLIDDAIPIDSSATPGGIGIPAFPLEPTPTPTPATVSAEDAAIVENYFAEQTSTPAVAAPSEPSQQTVAQPTFPIGSTVAVRGTTVNLHSLPRSNAEVIARLGPCACAMEVFGPMADSGDALWLPVTDLDTGVSGYLSLEYVLPPERFSRASFRVGQSVVTTTLVRLRGQPESNSIAADPLPPGTSLEITGDTISAGHFWIRVHDPVDGGEKWIAHDILVAATSPMAAAIPTPTPTPTPTPDTVDSRAQHDLATGQAVTITTDSVNFRASPEYDDSNVIQQLDSGDLLRITGEPSTADDTTWYPVELLTTGDTGYVVAEYIDADDSSAIHTPEDNPCPSTIPPTPTPSSASSGSASGGACAR